jgi:serine/threonine protein kinase
MSLVYLAQRMTDETEVVLKMMPIRPESVEDGDMLQRFIQEYALISQIQHPNISRIFEQGFTDTHAFIALEYFPGGDLRGLIKTRLQPDTAQAILIQVAGALSEIHVRGIVHRDLKPDNIMLRHDGSLAIADFGIAKHAAFAMALTRHGEVLGTPYYLSPEQALGKMVDSRSDLYSLGVMFYEMLTSRKPYYGDNVQSLLYQHVHGCAPKLPSELARYQGLLDRMMAKRVEDRFQTAEQLVEAVLKL